MFNLDSIFLMLLIALCVGIIIGGFSVFEYYRTKKNLYPISDDVNEIIKNIVKSKNKRFIDLNTSIYEAKLYFIVNKTIYYAEVWIQNFPYAYCSAGRLYTYNGETNKATLVYNWDKYMPQQKWIRRLEKLIRKEKAFKFEDK